MVDIYYNKNINKMNEYASTIISIPTGYGKTVLAIYVMCFLKRKTLIFCHTKNLFEQWIDRLNDYGDNINIGWIQGNNIKIKDANVIICMIQSIMNNKNNYNFLLRYFDFAIYDECHHMSAQTFSNVLNIIQTPYSLALSATPKRADRLEKVYEWSLGNIGYIIEGNIDQNIKIQIYKFKIDHIKFKMVVNRFNKKTNISLMMTNITEINERNNLIIKIIDQLLVESPTRNILVLSNRIEHLHILKEKLNKYQDDVSLYIGKMKKFELKLAATKKIILASNSIAEEGLDIYALDTIILCSPKSKILQCCGRILRRPKELYENIPLIIDINDELGIFNSMSRKRLKQYNDSYLKSEKSSIEFYKCNNETNFEIKSENNNQIKESIDYDNMFDSDS
jgi:superfamily II DNA or RNA helicase